MKNSKRLLTRRRVIKILLLVVVYFLGTYLYSRVAGRFRVVTIHKLVSALSVMELRSIPSREFKILAYNIAHGRGATDGNWDASAAEKAVRINEIADLLRKEDAEIVILNEVDFNSSWSGGLNQAEAIARAAGYPYWAEQRNLDFRVGWMNWRFGNAVLSRYPILSADAVEYPALNNWESWLVGQKKGMYCVIRHSSPYHFVVSPVHFEHRDENVRYESAKVLLDAIPDDLPFVCAGDFNSTPTGFPESRETTNGENAMDYLRDTLKTYPVDSPREFELTFPTSEPKKVIDWIMLSNAFDIDDYYAVDSDLSDHRPVVATVRLERPPAKEPSF